MKITIAGTLCVLVAVIAFMLSGIVESKEPAPAAELLASEWLTVAQSVDADSVPPAFLLGAEGECGELERVLEEYGHQRVDFTRRARQLYARWMALKLESEHEASHLAIKESEL